MTNPDKRFLIQPSNEKEGWIVVTDRKNGIVCRFKEGYYDDTQEFTVLNDIHPEESAPGAAASNLASAANEITAYLMENHQKLMIPIKEIREETRKRIGQTIRNLRHDSGMSVRDLAAAAGVGVGHIARLETGKYGASIDILAQIADVFDMEIDFCDKEDF